MNGRGSDTDGFLKSGPAAKTMPPGALRKRLLAPARLFVFFVIGSIALPSFARGQEAETSAEATKTVSGTVVSKDWVGSKITVRYSGFGSGRPDELTFHVSDDTQIQSGTKAISLSDIDQGDDVVIEYCRRSFAGLWARSIQDMNVLNHHGQ